MLNTFRILVELCMLRRAPQDLPYSPVLLGLLVIADAAVTFPALRGTGAGPGAGAETVFILGFGMLFIYAALHYRDLGNRFVQTAAAMFGTDALLTLIALPLIGNLPPHGAGAPQGAGAGTIGALVLVQLWTIFVIGHIWRHAFNTRFSVGTLLALGYTFASVILSSALFS